jgi:very-short-patch-repair endonuclease
MQQTDLSKAQARQLRQDMTPAERQLWQALRSRRFQGLKIRRKVPIGPYIADFFCAEMHLVIVTDSHGTPDGRRDHGLAARGFRVLRLDDRTILSDLSGCLGLIAAGIAPPPQPIDRPPSI